MFEACLEGRFVMSSIFSLRILQEVGPRQEELKGFDDPDDFLKIVSDEDKPRVLLNPNIFLMNSDDEELSFN